MAEELEIKVKADTGEAVANLGKAEKAVGGVTREVKKLDETSSAAAKKGLGTELSEGLNKTTGGFTKMLEATGKVTLIFGAAVAAGKALAAGIDAVAESLGKSLQRQMDAEARTIKFESALRLAQKGTIDLGHSTEEMLKNYDAYVEKLRGAEDATRAVARAQNELKMALDDIGAAVSKAQKETSFALVSPDKVQEDIKAIEALGVGLENALKKAFEIGGEEERDRWAEANKAAVEKVVETYTRLGREVPENIRAVSAAQDNAAAATEAWVQREVDAYDRLAKETERRRAAEDAAANRTSKAPAEFKHIQDAAFGAAVAAGELGTNLDNVAAAVVATGGTMTVGAPYMIQYAQATREATQALLDMAVAHKGLREEQAQALEATKGWTDYILTLKDGYESGTTTLYNYVTALGAFKTQLLQMFAGAKGEAKESLQAIIDLINELVRTAGAGGRETFSQGPLGDLERAIRDANRNRGR